LTKFDECDMINRSDDICGKLLFYGGEELKG
jgi:hypothetical protein